jgi:predicted phage tail protein
MKTEASRPLGVSAEHSLPEPALAELVARLADDIKQLTRQEAELAKHELGEKLDDAKRPAAALGLGVAALSAGLMVLLAASVLALATLMPAWSAALLVGALTSLLGAALLLTAKAQLSRLSFTPQRTLESVGRDVAAIKRAAT